MKQVILTIELPGRIAGRTSNNVPYPLQSCKRRTVTDGAFYEFVTSKEGRISNIAPSNWNRMSKAERLNAHLTLMAEGRKYTYEIVEAD